MLGEQRTAASSGRTWSQRMTRGRSSSCACRTCSMTPASPAPTNPSSSESIAFLKSSRSSSISEEDPRGEILHSTKTRQAPRPRRVPERAASTISDGAEPGSRARSCCGTGPSAELRARARRSGSTSSTSEFFAPKALVQGRAASRPSSTTSSRIGVLEVEARRARPRRPRRGSEATSPSWPSRRSQPARGLPCGLLRVIAELDEPSAETVKQLEKDAEQHFRRAVT